MVDVEKLKANYWIGKFETYLHSSNTVHSHSHISVPSLTLLLFDGIIVSLVILIVRQVLLMRRTLLASSVLLQITPPAFTEKSAFTTQQLFSHFHTLGKREGFINRLLGRKERFSFEIASSKQQGIRYFVRTSKDEANNVKRDILSYLPSISVKKVDEYLPEEYDKDSFHTQVIEFKQTKAFPYPLQQQDSLKEHDPVAYITGQMTKLLPGELLSFQLVISPTQTKETEIIRQKIMRGENVLAYVNQLNRSSYTKVLGVFFKATGSIGGIVGWSVKTFVNDLFDAKYAAYQRQSRYAFQYAVNSQIRPARVLTSFEQKAVGELERKIDQQLFETRIRLLVMVKDRKDLKERVRGFTSSLASFSVSDFQALKRKRNYLFDFYPKFPLLNFKRRLLSFILNSSPYLLSESEIADLYHFPYTKFTQTENIVKVHSKELPAPLSQKKGEKFDVLLGVNTYGGETIPIGLTLKKREKHEYLIGGTGMGKSTLLLYQISQDIRNGKGVGFIDPHGDTAKAIIPFVPESRINDFIYFDPDDLKFPIHINLLELTEGLSEEDALREKQFKMEAVVSLFHKSFTKGKDSHRIDYILRNVIQTAFTVKDCTMFTVFKLINNPAFQKEVVGNLKDEDLKDFWKNEFNKAGSWQQVKMVAGVTSKIGRFLFTPSVKRVLEKPNSTIDFDDILQNGKILICNFAKGNIGEENTELFGTLVLSQLQMAAQKRARILEGERRPYFLYVDEFQNFATPSFIQMLSESRKYKLYLIMAEQSTSQQEDRNLVDITMANVGITICFRSANPKDEEVMLTQLSPYVMRGEIMNLPMFRFYIKISATEPEEPFSGETVLPKMKSDPKKVERLLAASRKNYAREYKSEVSDLQEKIVVKKTKPKEKAVKENEEDTKVEGALPEQKKKS